MARRVTGMSYSQSLAAEIRAEAARKRMSGRDLGRYLSENGSGLSHGSIARMLRGERPWDVDSLSLVAKALDTSMATLLERGDDAMADNRCTLPSRKPSASSQVRGLEWALA